MSSLPVIEGVDGLSSYGWCCAVFDGSPVSLYDGVCVGFFFVCMSSCVSLLLLAFGASVVCRGSFGV